MREPTHAEMEKIQEIVNDLVERDMRRLAMMMNQTVNLLKPPYETSMYLVAMTRTLMHESHKMYADVTSMTTSLPRGQVLALLKRSVQADMMDLDENWKKER